MIFICVKRLIMLILFYNRLAVTILVTPDLNDPTCNSGETHDANSPFTFLLKRRIKFRFLSVEAVNFWRWLIVFSCAVLSQSSYCHLKPGTLQDRKHYTLCNHDRQAVSNSTEYTMNISVTLTDDPPLLAIPFHYIFEPIRNARTPLPSDVIQAKDSDSADSEIIFHVLGIPSGTYIEKATSPGRPVRTFSQEELNRGTVNFVHAGGPFRTRLLLQVDNDMELRTMQTSPAVLRVSAKALSMTGITWDWVWLMPLWTMGFAFRQWRYC